MFKFEVNQQYANRNGRYTVIATVGDKIHVRYDDGKEAQLKTSIQARIWNNMSIEQQMSVSGRRKQQDAVHESALAEDEQPIGYYIKIINAPSLDEFDFSGWADNVLMVPDETQATTIKPDDRVLIYVLNADNFVASVTVIGEVKMENPKVYFYTTAVSQETGVSPLLPFFPIEVDAIAHNLMDGIACDAIGLDKLSDFNKQLEGKSIIAESLININENDFESIAELLLELGEDDDDEDAYEPINDDDDDDEKQDIDEEAEEINA